MRYLDQPGGKVDNLYVVAVDLSECLVVMERAVQCLQCPGAIEVEGGRRDVYKVGGKETREGGGSGKGRE